MVESLGFASAVRAAGSVGRHHGLTIPGFRCPPRVPGVERTIRWSPDGTATVAILVRDRTAEQVAVDIAEGIAAVNDVDRQDDRIADVRRATLVALGVDV